MSDPSRPTRPDLGPPPAPPLPPPRPGTWQRLVAPLGFGQTSQSRPPSSQANRPTGSSSRTEHVRLNSYPPLPSQTAAHRTGIPIAALDCNGLKTHAVLAGHEILKTILIANGKVTEEVNLRSAVNTYSHSGHISTRRQFLDVKWSHGSHSHIIAAAAVNGPIVLYNVARRTELASLVEHRNQVHKLAFNPHAGYLLLSASQDGTIRMWDFRQPFGDGKAASSTRSSKQFAGRVGAVRDVRWSPTDIFEYVAGSDNGVIQKWDIRNPSAPALRINGHQKPCISVDWHPDGRHVVSGGFDRYARVWDFGNSNKQKQKPLFELRAPQEIRNIRWRPACWSAELTETGQWQSTQLITSYNQEDPRLHVWDLRRPHLPFRELDRYNSPATDLLWASKDLLWTVGNEGMFTQTDISFAPHPHNQIPPCAMHWSPDGEFITFAEDRTERRGSGNEDPAAGFLSVPHEKLSSGDDAAISRSLTDDEAGLDGLLTTSFKRRQSKAASARSAKSQASTPPGVDAPPAVLPLDKAVFERKDLFNNKQIGLSGSILGLSAEPDVVEYLAFGYRAASTEAERTTSPRTILQRLEEAFEINAEACDTVSMHRTAQTWRILGAVVVPELKAWADKNRTERLNRAYRRAITPRQGREKSDSLRGRELATPSPKPTGSTAKPQKILSNLFKGVHDTVKGDIGHEFDSNSNMTTPLARPLPDSPLSDTGPRFHGLDETMESMPPLPPSVLTAHTAAAMASRALLDNSSTKSETPPSSPEKNRKSGDPLRRHRRTLTSESVYSKYNSISSSKAVPQPIQKKPVLPSNPGSQRPIDPLYQDRRAALRDYRAPARPLLNFDDGLESPRSDKRYTQPHDSSESFPMFSSTDSSHREKSMGGSSNSPELQLRRTVTDDSLYGGQGSDEFEPSSPPSDDSAKLHHISLRFESSESNTQSRPPLSESTNFKFALDSQAESSEGVVYASHAAGERPRDKSDGPTSSAPVPSFLDEPFHFEGPSNPHIPLVHSSNPLRSRHAQEDRLAPPTLSSQVQEPWETEEDSKSQEYIFRDFRPIDLSEYDPVPFAWSALPLICHAIAFDISTGPACGQFSAHLLTHVYPYFFHQSFAHINFNQNRVTEGEVERLMQPSSGRRIIESILLDHASYLRKMRLWVPLTELRKICTDFDYPSVYVDGEVEDSKRDRLTTEDPYFLSAVCWHCHSPMTGGKKVCAKCKSLEAVCPICLSLEYREESIKAISTKDRNVNMFAEDMSSEQGMWTLCHSCGHGAHFGCLDAWLSHPYSQGACPSQGCGCDCGPGRVRKDRIERQILEKEMRALQSSNGPSLKKDVKKAGTSPAVHKTRHLLREGDRGTQSGDERGSTGRRVFSGHSQSSQRKSVRVLTPGEQKAGEAS